MTASPGSDSSGGAGTLSQLPAIEIPTQIRPIALTAGTFVSNAPTTALPSAAQKVANNLWAISSKPQDIPPMVGQQVAGPSTQLPTTSQVSVCVCPLDGTTVTHPVGIPCAALQCPVCGGRMVSGNIALTGGNPMTTTGGIQTGGKPEGVPPVQQVYYLVPITSKPDNVPLLGQGQQVAYIPVAGGATQGGPNTGGPTSGGPAIDGPAQGGGQAGTGAAQSGRSTLCICPMCKTTVTHPIGVPCASLTCPVCGSRLVNAEPGGVSSAAAVMTGGSPMVATGGMQTTGAMQVAQSSNVAFVSATSRRVVVPSTGKSLNLDIAPLLDKAPYFVMVGLGKYEIVRNPYYRDNKAVGTEVAQFIVGEGGAVVICNNISMTALKAFKDLKVKVYPGFTGTVKQALNIYADDRLKDSGTITGIAIEDSKTSEHEGGGGPPSSKDKKKDKGDTEIF